MADIDFDNDLFANICATLRFGVLKGADDGRIGEPGTLFEIYKNGGYPALLKDCTKLGHSIGVVHEPLPAPSTPAKSSAATSAER